MKTIPINRLMSGLLPIALLLLAATWQAPVQAATNCAGGTCVFGGNSNSAISNEEARQSKEEWDDTRMLRKKVNTRVEKQFDKFDSAIDTRDDCDKSMNLNAYWEANTQRCLDRKTGRQINP